VTLQPETALIIVQELARGDLAEPLIVTSDPMSFDTALERQPDAILMELSAARQGAFRPLDRARERFRDVPLLVLGSGDVTIDDAVESLKRGAADFITPGRLTDLAAAIQRARADATRRMQLREQLLQSQKMEAVGRLAGGIAHDFNNLLTAILGYSELLMGDLPPDSVRSSAQAIREAADRAASFTRQLLSFSRRRSANAQILNINAVVAEAETTIRGLIGDQVEVRVHMDARVADIKADPVQINQVLLNLAVNARDAMPGGGRLGIETANVVLDESAAEAHAGMKPGGYVLLTVRDTGIGMTPEVKSRLFEPFFTTRDPGKGSGLGLSTVYGIVRQSGAQIWVDSEPGRGSTFRIYFPVISESAGSMTAAQVHRPAEARPRTVLLVENDEFILELTRAVLVREGYSVLTASSGGSAEAIAKEHSGSIDLVLTDVVTPGMSGKVLCERIRRTHPEIKVLYVSEYTEDAMAQNGVLEPGAPWVRKPCSPQDLARHVREVLRSRG
jgi:signal transduction histidine kinase